MQDSAHGACFNIGDNDRGGTLISWSRLHALYILKDGTTWAQHSDFVDRSDLVGMKSIMAVYLSVSLSIVLLHITQSSEIYCHALCSCAVLRCKCCVSRSISRGLVECNYTLLIITPCSGAACFVLLNLPEHVSCLRGTSSTFASSQLAAPRGGMVLLGVRSRSCPVVHVSVCVQQMGTGF